MFLLLLRLPACPPACNLGACYGSDHMVTRLPHPCPNLPACLIAQCCQRGARRRVCARLWLHWRQCHAGGGGGDGSQGAGHGLIPCAGLLLAADCCWQSGPQADARRRSIARPASHATCLSCWRYLCCCCHPCSYARSVIGLMPRLSRGGGREQKPSSSPAGLRGAGASSAVPPVYSLLCLASARPRTQPPPISDLPAQRQPKKHSPRPHTRHGSAVPRFRQPASGRRPGGFLQPLLHWCVGKRQRQRGQERLGDGIAAGPDASAQPCLP